MRVRVLSRAEVEGGDAMGADGISCRRWVASLSETMGRRSPATSSAAQLRRSSHFID
jgi:hypothetical protein